MNDTNYSLAQASLEIIGLTLLMFILGILTCSLLRKLGICCRSAADDEPSLFTLKEPAAFDFEASPTHKAFTPEVQNSPAFNEATIAPSVTPPELTNTSTPLLNTQFETPTPTPRQDLITPTLEIELPTPSPTTIIKPELNPVTMPSSIAHTDTTEPSVSTTNTGYVVDIDTLLRRKPEEPPAATIAAANKYHGTGTDAATRSSTLDSVSLANLLNTPADLIDNLRKLEGITPRIEALLNEAGIRNYQTLSQKSLKDLKQILSAAGEQFKQIDPQTWPFQAELAAKGEWNRLQDYQTYLKNNPS
ncbi:MAG: hypothetical protein WAQ53_06195 [Thiofilum sp.]|uniref:hypothetical protein n=1 Tax=Thiofilum sp. TaxID=2212733 RepID=UPI0025FB2788|nr:hypothetical protein [Thiofilum sp.]MBK8455195.1 hypothetical protein [Thiofilum sp.]